MNKESLKEKLRIQSNNFEKALQRKMLYFNEGENKYFILDDWVWDKQSASHPSVSDPQEEEQVIEKGRLSYSPMKYQDRLDILQEEAEMEIYKRIFLE